MENLIEITNRSRGSVYYTIPDTGAHRVFASGETKKVSLEELQKLQWVEGGSYMLKNYFIVNNQDALTALNMAVEPEYYYTEKEIKELLTTGNMDQLEDALNFAPKGVIDLIQQFAVDMQIPDMRKRELITKKTGFDINSAININIQMADPEGEEGKEEAETKRKSQPIKINEAAPARKTQPVIIKK